MATHPVYSWRNYIASLRNKKKQAYAIEYLAWIRGQRSQEPDAADPAFAALRRWSFVN